jgi:asparagine synthase (glutamine-hydrolysing)
MCGIIVVVNSAQDLTKLRQTVLGLSKRIRHRGPDWSGIHVQTVSAELSNKTAYNVLAHERLAIVGLASGAQPLVNGAGDTALAVNGEIYNHRELRSAVGDQAQFATNSDCEPILHLYPKLGDALVKRLDGIFSFVLTRSDGSFLAARDPIGRAMFLCLAPPRLGNAQLRN